MTDIEKAELLLQLLDKAGFPGSQRKMVMELADWLESIITGQRKVVQAAG